MNTPLLTMTIAIGEDLVAVRRRARQICALLGINDMEQARVGTAVSEIARNALMYAGGGKAEFLLREEGAAPLLEIVISDKGPGIADPAAVIESRNRAGGGMGLASARRLMDYLRIEPNPGGGTVVRLGKRFPKSVPVPRPQDLAQIAKELARQEARDPLEEVRQQNQELMRTMGELRARQEDLERVNSELEDTNRGVVALYAELDERAVHLKRADELKTRFLSNMSHEFRTPLNAILALSRMLLDREDGDLTPEQERQLTFIQKSAQELSDLVNDLLDIAKVEAGRITVNRAEMDAADLFGGLRGMFRPLLAGQSVNLVFEEPQGVPLMYTDGAKVSQILRNLISNAIKFTERGEVRVSARLNEDEQTVTFSVSDTGIGIAEEDQQRIFEEFAQVESPIQQRVRGTGLGLPLSKRLAELLGGSISVKSRLGEGSTFSVTIPVRHSEAETPAEVIQSRDVTRHSVLLVEDDPSTALLYDKYMKGTGFQLLVARDPEQARRLLEEFRPVAIVLDLVFPNGTQWSFLDELKQNEQTRSIPVIVASVVNEPERGKAMGADEYFVKPIDRSRLLDALRNIVRDKPAGKVLVVDDDEVSRYLMRDLLVVEARGGVEGLKMARELRPEIILLDLLMPDLSGEEVLDRLQADERTRGIPVILVTSRALSDEERKSLEAKAVAVLAKGARSRQESVARLRAALAKAGSRRAGRAEA
jgi:signal transduction histidine kinase/CheY-like chemotaxis protein